MSDGAGFLCKRSVDFVVRKDRFDDKRFSSGEEHKKVPTVRLKFACRNKIKPCIGLQLFKSPEKVFLTSVCIKLKHAVSSQFPLFSNFVFAIATNISRAA